MPQWSSASLPAPLNHAPGFKQLEQKLSEQDTTFRTGALSLPSLAVYANNAAAIAGGLVAGQVYRTATGQLMVTY